MAYLINSAVVRMPSLVIMLVLWNWAVFTAMPSFDAISFAERPSATSRSTSRWREVSLGAGARSEERASLAIEELTYALPLITSHIAVSNSAAADRFRTYPEAPARKASRTISAWECMLMRITLHAGA